MARKKFAGHYIWNTLGDWIATLIDGYLWDPSGYWIGWVDSDGEVYKIDGDWVGTLSKDYRIVRKRSFKRRDPNPNIPDRPEKPELPVRATLPPAFAELPFSIIDVLDEYPDIFGHVSELRPDMD